MVLIAASMLSSDLSNLEYESKRMIRNNVDILHMDIMDGVFVNNLTFGYPVIKSLKQNLPNVKLDCHLMVIDPLKLIDRYIKYAYSISFHIEVCPNSVYTFELINKIKSNNILVGVALKPSTKLGVLNHLIEIIDYVLIMSVEPGFSGQKFITKSIKKINELRKKYPNLIIQVDGGVNLDNNKDIIKAGANILVSGSTLFNSSNISKTVNLLKN